MLSPVKIKALGRGLKNAVLLLCRGEGKEFLIRLRISLGQVDLRNDLSETVTDRTHYYADSGGLAFDKLMAHFDIKPQDAIIDFGCGKGGILISLSKYPFAKIMGVEISPKLAATAKDNIRKLKIRNVAVECSDAARFKDLDGYNYFYFFDPFPEVVMQDVLRNIEQSIIDRPRTITIIYLNPFCHELIESRGVFSRVGELPHFEHDCFVYSNIN